MGARQTGVSGQMETVRGLTLGHLGRMLYQFEIRLVGVLDVKEPMIGRSVHTLIRLV